MVHMEYLLRWSAEAPDRFSRVQWVNIYRNHLERSAEANPNFADYVDGVIGRGVWGNYSDNTNTDTRLDWADYSAARQDWSQVQFLHRFGNVVQTLRQAVARIVRRAKWRRIIRGLKLQTRALFLCSRLKSH